MIISISGAAGSGKSTVGKILAEKLGYDRYYIGGIRRKMAKEKGLTLAEYNRLGEKDPSTDLEVDEYQKKLGETADNFIIEGRTSWYFIPHSIKIFLDVDEKVGAERIFLDLKKNPSRNEGKNLNSVKEVLKSNRQRKKSDIKRYKKYYNINAYDTSNYDLVIDTTDKTPREVVAKIMEFIENHKQ